MGKWRVNKYGVSYRITVFGGALFITKQFIADNSEIIQRYISKLRSSLYIAHCPDVWSSGVQVYIRNNSTVCIYFYACCL